MKKVSIISAEEAALKVQDGDTIATGGFVSCACPETLSKALEKRFLETGHPNNLTLSVSYTHLDVYKRQDYFRV